MHFNENLKYFMECKGILSKELSAKTQISLNTINSYLKNNGSLPDVEKAVRIAEILEIPVEVLVKGVLFHKNQQSQNILKPEIINIEEKLIHFSKHDLEAILNIVNSIWEKYNNN